MQQQQSQFDRNSLSNDAVFMKLCRYIPTALDETDHSIPESRWNNLIKMVSDPTDREKLNLLNETLFWKICVILSHSTSKINPSYHSPLIELILTYECHGHVETVKTWLHLLISLCSTSVNWVKMVLKSLCRVLCGNFSSHLYKKQLLETNPNASNDTSMIDDFVPTTGSVIKVGGGMIDRLDQLHSMIQTAMGQILALVPMCSGHIINAFISAGPHYTANLYQQCLWVNVLLRACEMHTVLRDSLLTAILEKLLSLDVHISRRASNTFQILETEYVSNSLRLVATSANSIVSHTIIRNIVDVLAKEDINATSKAKINNDKNEKILNKNDKNGKILNKNNPIDTDSSPQSTEVMINGVFTKANDTLVSVNQHGQLEVVNNTITVDDVDIQSILAKNDELRSIDGLMAILTSYLWLVATTPDTPDQHYNDPLNGINKTNTIKSETGHNNGIKSENGIKTESHSLLKNEENYEKSELKIENGTLIAPLDLPAGLLSTKKRRQNVQLTQEQLDKLSPHERELVLLMDTANNAKKSTKNTNSGKLESKSTTNSTNNSTKIDPTTSNSLEKIEPHTLLPPQLIQTVSERALHEGELTFELSEVLDQTRLCKMEDTDDISNPNSPITNAIINENHRDIFDNQTLHTMRASKLNDDVFSSFFRTFNRSILPTQGPHFVQWLIYIQCSYRFEYTEVLLRLLTDRLFSHRSNNTIRINCILYISSLLVRAQFLRITSAVSSLISLAQYAHTYIDSFLTQYITQSTLSNGNQGSSGQNASVMTTDSYANSTQNQLSPENHIVFYTLIETLLYIATLRPDLMRHVRPLTLTTANNTTNNNNNNNSNNNNASIYSIASNPNNNNNDQHGQKHSNKTTNGNNPLYTTNTASKIQSRRSTISPNNQFNDDNQLKLPLNQSNMNKKERGDVTGKLAPKGSGSFLDNGSNQLSPLLSPLLSGTSVATIPSLTISNAANNTNKAINLTKSSHNTNVFNIVQTELISKHAKPTIIDTKHINLASNTHDPLHFIWLLTSFLRPTQYLSPLLVERYLLLYHNTISLATLYDFNQILNSQAFHSNNNTNNNYNGVSVYGNHNTYAHTSSSSHSNGRDLDHALSQLGQFVARTPPLLLPTVYIPSIEQSINMSMLISTHSTSVAQSVKLLSQLTTPQRIVLSTFIKQQLQAYRCVQVNAMASYSSFGNVGNGFTQPKAPKFNNLFDHVTLSSTNPLITFPDLQQVGIYPVLHPHSPLAPYARRDAVANKTTASEKAKKSNSQSLKAGAPLATNTVTPKAIAEQDAEYTLNKSYLTPEEYQLGLPTLQISLSFLHYPFDPFFLPTVRDVILHRYLLNFDTFQAQARFYHLFKSNLSLQFRPPESLLHPPTITPGPQAHSSPSHSPLFKSINEQNTLYIKLGDVPINNAFVTSLHQYRSQTSSSSSHKPMTSHSLSNINGGNSNNQSRMLTQSGFLPNSSRNSSPFVSPLLKPHGSVTNSGSLVSNNHSNASMSGFVPVMPLFGLNTSPSLNAIATSTTINNNPGKNNNNDGKNNNSSAPQSAFNTMKSLTNHNKGVNNANNNNNNNNNRRSTIHGNNNNNNNDRSTTMTDDVTDILNNSTYSMYGGYPGDDVPHTPSNSKKRHKKGGQDGNNSTLLTQSNSSRASIVPQSAQKRDKSADRQNDVLQSAKKREKIEKTDEIVPNSVRKEKLRKRATISGDENSIKSATTDASSVKPTQPGTAVKQPQGNKGELLNTASKRPKKKNREGCENENNNDINKSTLSTGVKIQPLFADDDDDLFDDVPAAIKDDNAVKSKKNEQGGAKLPVQTPIKNVQKHPEVVEKSLPDVSLTKPLQRVNSGQSSRKARKSIATGLTTGLASSNVTQTVPTTIAPTTTAIAQPVINTTTTTQIAPSEAPSTSMCYDTIASKPIADNDGDNDTIKISKNKEKKRKRKTLIADSDADYNTTVTSSDDVIKSQITIVSTESISVVDIGSKSIRKEEKIVEKIIQREEKVEKLISKDEKEKIDQKQIDFKTPSKANRANKQRQTIAQQGTPGVALQQQQQQQQQSQPSSSTGTNITTTESQSQLQTAKKRKRRLTVGAEAGEVPSLSNEQKNKSGEIIKSSTSSVIAPAATVSQLTVPQQMVPPSTVKKQKKTTSEGVISVGQPTQVVAASHHITSAKASGDMLQTPHKSTPQNSMNNNDLKSTVKKQKDSNSNNNVVNDDVKSTVKKQKPNKNTSSNSNTNVNLNELVQLSPIKPNIGTMKP